MNIWIGGKQQGDVMNDEINRRASDLLNDPLLKPQPGSLDTDLLGNVKDTNQGNVKFLEMLRHKSQIDTQTFTVPRKPGLMGEIMAKVRKFLWKILRYQHDRMSTRQNRVNSWIISLVESRTETLQADMNQLQERLAKLESSQNPNTSLGPDLKA